jgi:hypothetical protein
MAENRGAITAICTYLAEKKAAGKQVSSSGIRAYVREELSVSCKSALFAPLMAEIEAQNPHLKGVYKRSGRATKL